MGRSRSEIMAEIRATRHRMDNVSDDIAFALMNGRVDDARKLATGVYAELYRKRARLVNDWNEANESGCALC